MRVHVNVPVAAVIALGLVCLVLVVAGGAYPLATRSNWQWSWESPARAFIGYTLAAAGLAGAGCTAWFSLGGGGRWTHVGLAVTFVVLAAIGILLLWRSGVWLSDFRVELLPVP